MQNLLYKSTRSGYPVDFLLPRIRGRLLASQLEQNRTAVESGTYLANDSVIWSEAATERYRLYQLMEFDLRKVLSPVFVYFELNTFVLCLRSIEAQQVENLVVDLENSLLSEDLKKIILAKSSLFEIVEKLERFLENSDLKVKGLAAAYEEEGVKGCEELIRNTFLQAVITSCSHPEVTLFFRSLIDLKNTVTMAKCLRWEKEAIPVGIQGGKIRMLKSEEFPSEETLKKMIRRFAGGLEVTANDLHPIRMEPLLRSFITLNLTRRMRGNDPVCMCIGYLWKSSEAARKRSGEFQATLFVENFPDVLEGTE